MKIQTFAKPGKLKLCQGKRQTLMFCLLDHHLIVWICFLVELCPTSAPSSISGVASVRSVSPVTRQARQGAITQRESQLTLSQQSRTTAKAAVATAVAVDEKACAAFHWQRSDLVANVDTLTKASLQWRRV